MTSHFKLSTARRSGHAFTLKQRGRRGGFTLAEMLISVAVLTLLVLMLTQLMNNAAPIARTANKHIDTDTQARTVLDRIAVDLARMLKRTDVDYYLKGPTNYTGHGNGHAYGRRVQTGQQGSDQIAFFSQVPGYYPSGAQSPVSLVAYRINSSPSLPSYLKLERMGKGLLWNGVSNLTNLNTQNTVYPIVFLPQTISGIANAGKMWSDVVNNPSNATIEDSSYETIGPGVFRFEYYYLLKNGQLTDVPWDQTARPTQTSLTNPVNIGLTDVQAIAVAIAVIDPAGRALIPPSSLFDLASDLADFRTAPGRGVGGQKNLGDLEYSWNTSLLTDISAGQASTGSPVPPAASKAIRIYGRTFDLRTL
jgi:prepilin-type N-terminal cleavage/methylation domain-containing protein